MLNVSRPPPPYSSRAPRVQSPAALVLAERRTKSSRGISGASGSMRLLERDDLVLDEPADLLAEQAQLLRQREAGEQRHGGVALETVMWGDHTTARKTGYTRGRPGGPAGDTPRREPEDEEALVPVGADGRLRPPRAGGRGPRGRAAGLHRCVVLRGGRRGRLHAAHRHRAHHADADRHRHRQRLHARARHARLHRRRAGGRRARALRARHRRGLAADRGVLERRRVQPARHARARDRPVPARGAGRRARRLQGRDVHGGRLPPDQGARAPVPIYIARPARRDAARSPARSATA